MGDILTKVRQAREAYARQFDFDLEAIHRDLKALEQESGRRVVPLPPRRPRPRQVPERSRKAEPLETLTTGPMR